MAPGKGRIHSACQVLMTSRPIRNKLTDSWPAPLTTVRRNGGRNCGEIFLPTQNEYVGGPTLYSEEGEGEDLGVGHKRAEKEHSHE